MSLNRDSTNNTHLSLYFQTRIHAQLTRLEKKVQAEAKEPTKEDAKKQPKAIDLIYALRLKTLTERKALEKELEGGLEMGVEVDRAKGSKKGDRRLFGKGGRGWL